MDVREIEEAVGGPLAIRLLARYSLVPKVSCCAQARGRVQEVAVTAKNGYSRDVIRVRKGIPLRIIFDRQESDDCSARVVPTSEAAGHWWHVHHVAQICAESGRRIRFRVGINMPRDTLAPRLWRSRHRRSMQTGAANIWRSRDRFHEHKPHKEPRMKRISNNHMLG